MFVLDQFNGLKALVVGDVMIDAYSHGVIERMSPEAPVPIVNIRNRFNRLGGAANVAVNLKAMGADPLVVSVTGKDPSSSTLIQLMHQQGLDCHGIFQSTHRKTTIKHRIFDQDKQLLRIDEEDCFDLCDEEYHILEENIKKIIDENHVDVIILQDYNKGVLSSSMIQFILNQAHGKAIPVAVDPKKNNFFNYQEVTLFKPNAKELRDGLSTHAETIDELREAAFQMQRMIHCKYLMVTLSEQGVMILHDGDFLHLPAHPRNIVDVSGAGDTVLSVAALCVASHYDAPTIAHLSNIAGGLVCEEVGVSPIDKQRFTKEIQRLCHG